MTAWTSAEMGRRCAACAAYIDHDLPDDQPGEATGYCGHPFHATIKSPHYDYGGHWTHKDATCEMFTSRVVSTAIELDVSAEGQQ